MSEIQAPVSFGELLDKIAILQIKSERMTDPAKLANVRHELSALESTWMAHPAARGDIARLRQDLKAVNERLWVIEDDIRLKEKAQAFDQEFIALARAHLGMSYADAAALSMTELQQLMRVKFPPEKGKGGAKNVPTRAEYDAAMQRLKATREKRGE